MRIAIFDFDDTLFPTTEIGQKGKTTLSPELTCNLLQYAYYNCDKVFIITNANREWIESATKMYENCDILFQVIPIITTEELEVKHNPFDRIKTLAFLKVLEPYFSNKNSHHLLCFGDAIGDFYAGKAIREKYKNVIVKNIHLMERPSGSDLAKQQSFIMRYFRKFLTEPKHIDMRLKFSE